MASSLTTWRGPQFCGRHYFTILRFAHPPKKKAAANKLAAFGRAASRYVQSICWKQNCRAKLNYCKWFSRVGLASAVLSLRGVIDTTM